MQQVFLTVLLDRDLYFIKRNVKEVGENEKIFFCSV